MLEATENLLDDVACFAFVELFDLQDSREEVTAVQKRRYDIDMEICVSDVLDTVDVWVHYLLDLVDVFQELFCHLFLQKPLMHLPHLSKLQH